MSNVETKTRQQKHASDKNKIRKKMSKAEMQLAIIKKKQCDAKALTIVEQLLEPVVNVQWFLENLKFINRSHLEDVIEERAIVKLCGYALCNNPLTVVITQQYHISIRKNKVYDVSKRKNFCSSRCYGASTYLLEQMLTSPLWLRDKEDTPVFKLLPPTHVLQHSTPGEEVVINPNNFGLNEQQDTRSRTQSCTEECSAKVDSESTYKQDILNKNTEGLDELINNFSSEYVKNILNSSDDPSDRLNTVCPEYTGITDVENTKVSLIKTDPQSPNSLKQKLTTAPNSHSTDFNTETLTKAINVKKKDEVVSNVCEIENIESHKNIIKFEEPHNSIISPVSDLTGKENATEIDEKLEVRENSEVLLKTSESNKQETESSATADVVHDKSCKKRGEKKKNKSTSESSKKSSKSSTETYIYSLAMRVEKSVKEWITEDTLCLLLGEADQKQKLIEDITKHDKYLHICKRLNRLQIEDGREERTDSKTKDTLKPLPCLSDLEEQGKKMELKVRAFYNGRMEIGAVVETDSATKKDEPDPIFPLIDSYAPKALRRRIFLDKLNRTLPDLLRALAGNSPPYITAQYMYSSERCSAIKTLATTFALSATNIVFKTAEWTLVGLILMKLLGIMDPSLKALLLRKQASMYISMILMSYKLDSNYLDRLVAEITNNPDVFGMNDDS